MYLILNQVYLIKKKKKKKKKNENNFCGSGCAGFLWVTS